jgi:hypothetical protein
MDNKTPTHRVTNVEIISDDTGDTFGVKFTFDDGDEEYAFSDTKEEAEWDATDRIGEEMPIGMNPKLRTTAPQADANDGKPWSEMDIEDLKAAISAYCSSLKATAEILCRSGTVSDVAAKAKELGHTWAAETKSPDKPHRKTDD